MRTAADKQVIGFAGFGASIDTESARLRELVEASYRGFDSASPILRFEAVVRESRAPARPEVRVERTSDSVSIDSSDFSAVIDLRERVARIEQRCAVHPIDSCLRIAYSALHPEHGGFLLHAGAVVRDGRAYVFCGPSGAGKTTIVDLLGGMGLADEVVAIVPSSRGFAAAGTPYWVGTDASAPISALFFLRPSDTTRAVPHAGDTAQAIWQSVQTAGLSNSDAASVRAKCRVLADTVPCRELHFALDRREVWRAIEGGVV